MDLQFVTHKNLILKAMGEFWFPNIDDPDTLRERAKALIHRISMGGTVFGFCNAVATSLPTEFAAFFILFNQPLDSVVL